MQRAQLVGFTKYWAIPVAIACVAIAIQMTGRPEVLRLERASAWAEPWRLATGQFTHLGRAHLLLNMAGLLLVWLLLGRAMGTWAWLAVMFCSGAGVAAGLLWLSPEVAWYVGLSGILHGMLAAGAVVGLRRAPGTAVSVLLLLLVKLGLEQGPSSPEFTARLVGGNVIVNAHLYGAVAGLLAGIVVLLKLLRPGFR